MSSRCSIASGLDVVPAPRRPSSTKRLFADDAYDQLILMDKAAYLDLTVEIIRRSERHKGFQTLPRRWVVERTSGWMMRWQRLVRDYEKHSQREHSLREVFKA
jgi:transposase